MSNISVPEKISKAYNDVRSDDSPINWLILCDKGKEKKKEGEGEEAAADTQRGDVLLFDKLKKSALVLSATGEGGLAELAENLDPAQVQYGYVRVEYANDSESKRVKFVLVIWIGDEAGGLRIGRVISEAGEVEKVLAHSSFQRRTGDKSELREDVVVKRLREVGGADYNGGRG